MRSALFAVVAALLVAVPASAAEVDPATLVLRPSDVPAGFRLDSDESGVRSNELEAKEYPATRPLFARWGRVTGYQAAYERKTATIEARSDVFRTAAGARELLLWADREWRKSGISGQKRAATDIGTEGWVYWSRGDLAQTLVLWRHGRVFSGLMGLGVPRERTLTLARKQERRIAAALR